VGEVDPESRGFLARWSERKLRARRETEVGDVPPEAESESAAPAEGAEDPEEAQVLTDADMPPLESLDETSDYSGFLSPGVSRDLRGKALSKLFHGAGFNVADGLDDYAEDFTSFLPLGDVITSDMRHRMQAAAERLLADEDDAAEPDPETACARDENASNSSSAPPHDDGQTSNDGDPA
jgi:hypothetical protein